MEPTIVNISIKNIEINESARRAADPEKVSALSSSIKEIGLLNPIIVDSNYKLIAGLHRIRAHERLGINEIPARIAADLNGIKARLAEIDENLIRNDLTEIEQGLQLAERKRIYLELYPETGNGKTSGNQYTGQKRETDNLSFSQDAATKTGSSERTIERKTRIGEQLADYADDIRGTVIEDNQSELLKLAKTKDEERLIVIEQIKSGAAKSVKQAKANINFGARIVQSKDTCTISDLSMLIERKMKYGCIYADPPWKYGNQGTRAATGNHYEGMSINELCAMPIADLAAEDSHLHLWTTNGFLEDAFKVMKAWGFEYKSCFVWVKPQMGIGNYWRVSHEFMLLGIRGNLAFSDKSLMSWVSHSRAKHSAKPEIVRDMIIKASPGPYLELFGRRYVEGWTIWGNEIHKDLFYREAV